MDDSSEIELTAPVGAKTFRDFGIAEPICAALEAEGITTAFPIQALTLPVALDGHDLIGQARTGTGKTLAFGIPILERLDTTHRENASPRSLIVVPTRELAIQVADDLRLAGSRLDAKVVTLYGGRAYEPQIDALASVDIVVGTPGRLLDLARQGHLKLGKVATLVLDEADKMLDLGFLPDVERILQLTPASRQTMLFSATMPGEIVTLARRHLSRPMHIRAEQHDEPQHVPSTQQHVFRAHQMDKLEVLARILQAEGRGLTIVFCRTKRSCDQVATTLTTKGFAAGAVHGDLGQSQRERAMRAFRAGKVDVLVATDVAARGLDVDDVTHVVNYECPEDEKAYLHRIGRTGRAGRDGVAVTFVDWADLSRWKTINDVLHLDFPEPLETYSTSEHLYAALNIPAAAKGVLPRDQRGRAGLEAEKLEDIGETGKMRSRSSAGGARGRELRPGSTSSRTRGHTGDGDGREAGPRKPRSRRRTRAGQTAAGNAAAPDAFGSPDSDDRGGAVDVGQAAASGSAAAGDQASARKSRRRPSSRGRGVARPAASEAAASETTASETTASD
ncbi:MAG TPA: DEAD/DEAH box helicase [Streptosporangiaceae bacterium]|nr:DEAD/DEAH box helicase [Streptosporangiaceae bacterium]